MMTGSLCRQLDHKKLVLAKVSVTNLDALILLKARYPTIIANSCVETSISLYRTLLRLVKIILQKCISTQQSVIMLLHNDITWAHWLTSGVVSYS